MRRLPFFALLASCASHDVATVEIAQPLPTVTSAELVTPAPRVAIAEALEFEGLRDPRQTRKREAALVTAEVNQLAQLFAATPLSSPDRPVILWRLAQDCVELRKSHVEGAGQRAIEWYKRLIDEHSTYARLPDVLYELGLEYELAGDKARARKAQYELIQKYPQSPLVAYAYFAFGEMFMAEAATDPTKLELAAQSYREALKLSSPLTGACVCRLAHIFRLKHDDAAAASLLQKYGQSCGA